MAIKAGIKDKSRNLVHATLLEVIAITAIKDGKKALKVSALQDELMLPERSDVIEALEELAELGGVSVAFDGKNEDEPYEEIEVTGFKIECTVRHKEQRALDLRSDAQEEVPDKDEFLANGVPHRLELITDGAAHFVKIVADDATGGYVAFEHGPCGTKAEAWKFGQAWRWTQVWQDFYSWLEAQAALAGVGNELLLDEETYDLAEKFCADVAQTVVQAGEGWQLQDNWLTKDDGEEPKYRFNVGGDSEKHVPLAWSEAGARWPVLGAKAQKVTV